MLCTHHQRGAWVRNLGNCMDKEHDLEALGSQAINGTVTPLKRKALELANLATRSGQGEHGK